MGICRSGAAANDRWSTDAVVIGVVLLSIGFDVTMAADGLCEVGWTGMSWLILFYGRQSSPPPWTTDCPVRLDVWWEFAQPSPYGLGRRVDLILTIREDHGVADVLRQLQVHDLPHARPAAVGGFVVVSLSLPELMRVVVPLTNLEGIVRTASRPDRPRCCR